MQVTMMKARNILKLYQQALTRWPYLMQAIQTGSLMATGDIISQTFIESKSFKQLDVKRTIGFSSIGFFVGVSYTFTISPSNFHSNYCIFIYHCISGTSSTGLVRAFEQPHWI